MSDEVLTFNNSVEFIDYITDHKDLIRENFKENFPAIFQNMRGMRESLDRRPCSCGGVNPDAVIAERTSNFESFYKTWIDSLDEENIKNLKHSLEDNSIIFKSNEEVILEL